MVAAPDVLEVSGCTERIGIEEMNDLEDVASADALSGISRAVDKWLSLVEARRQGNRFRRHQRGPRCFIAVKAGGSRGGWR